MFDISIDLSVAFDLVNVNLLIKRLTIIGLPRDSIGLKSIFRVRAYKTQFFLTNKIDTKDKTQFQIGNPEPYPPHQRRTDLGALVVLSAPRFHYINEKSVSFQIYENKLVGLEVNKCHLLVLIFIYFIVITHL